MTKSAIKICMVDDNKDVCESFKFLFYSIYNLEVEIYHHPLTFLEQFSSEWRGCLIIDYSMPTMNGVELLQELKNRNCGMSVIMTSGIGSQELTANSLAAGADAFISKPKIDNLIEHVNKIIQSEKMLLKNKLNPA